MTEIQNTLILILTYIFNSALLTIKILIGLFLPIIICCVILNVLAREQNRRLIAIGGWKALFLTAWIGTPIHELSHFLMAVISNHKIIDLQLFKPDKRTGSMGYMTHSYREDNFFQSVIGNTFIAIAPFFGGAAVIYLISTVIFPDFSLYSDSVPKIYYLNLKNLTDWNSIVLIFNSHIQFFWFLIQKIFSGEMLGSWKLYLYLFLMFGIANHLSPSGTDFKNFWQPAAMLLATLMLFMLVLYPIIKNPDSIIDIASGYIFVFIPILYFAIFISLLWLMLTYIIYTIYIIFR